MNTTTATPATYRLRLVIAFLLACVFFYFIGVPAFLAVVKGLGYLLLAFHTHVMIPLGLVGP